MKRTTILTLTALLAAALSLAIACSGTLDLQIETTPAAEATITALQEEKSQLTTAVATTRRMPGGRIPSGAYLGAMPIAMIALAALNLLLAAGILQLPWKRAAVLGGAMGLLTAPWAILLV